MKSVSNSSKSDTLILRNFFPTLPLQSILRQRGHFLANHQSMRPQNLYQATHPLLFLPDAIFFIITLLSMDGHLLPNNSIGKNWPLSASRPFLPHFHQFSSIYHPSHPPSPLLQQSNVFSHSGCEIIIDLHLLILRRQRKDKNGHSPPGSVLGYSDPANEKLLPGPRNGTINHRWTFLSI